MSIKTIHIGTVENNNAVISEERYCSPYANNPCPRTIRQIPIIIAFFHCFLLLIICNRSGFLFHWFVDVSMFSVCFPFLSNILSEYILYIKNYIRPEIVYRIPDINNGGIVSIEIFIARYVEAIIIHVNTRINHILFMVNTRNL